MSAGKARSRSSRTAQSWRGPAQQLSGFFDLSQIEVLRGPQSILYGRGATAGAINLVTAAPTDEMDGYLRATYGNYDNRVLEGAIGGPLAGDPLDGAPRRQV